MLVRKRNHASGIRFDVCRVGIDAGGSGVDIGRVRVDFDVVGVATQNAERRVANVSPASGTSSWTEARGHQHRPGTCDRES